METLTVEVAVPSDLFALLGHTRRKVAASVKEFSVLGLYQERTISAGKAAELLDMSKQEFARFLARKSIPYFNYTQEELEDDFRVVDEWPAGRAVGGR
jgi:hypothetical protein